MQAEQLVAIHRNYNGEIISFKTSKGRIISYQKALQEAKNGVITGVHITEDIDGQAAVLVPQFQSNFHDLPEIY